MFDETVNKVGVFDEAFAKKIAFLHEYNNYLCYIQPKIIKEAYTGNNAKECCNEMIGMSVKRLAEFNYPLSNVSFVETLRERVFKYAKQYRTTSTFCQGLANIGHEMYRMADLYYQGQIC